MSSHSQLALLGGTPAVSIAHPHFVWPYPSSSEEKTALGAQRDKDISIKGSSGPIRELEDGFREFLEGGRKYVISYNSGTSALLAAYFALGIGEGDEVICPAITYHAAVSPLYFLKATPVLVDVDLESWTLDPKLIEAAITPKTKAITVVHQWGHPGEMDAIVALAKKHQLAIVEDCSHAHGSRYKGQLVGTFGEVAVFSLQANKVIFAGEGGLLVTNSDLLHDRATLLGHYRDRARDEIKDPFYQQFWVTGYGLKLRMSPYNAITAIYSLKDYQSNKSQRHQCLTYFTQQLAGLPEISVPVISPDVDMGAWYGYKPRYHADKLNGLPRDTYLAALKAEGLEIGEPGSPAFSQLPLFTIQEDRMYHNRQTKRVYQPGDFPQAETLAAEGLSLPTFSRWPHDQAVIDQYVAAFHKVHDLAQELL